MKKRKRDAIFGRYPACDHLNNAIRFILQGNKDAAINQIVAVINFAGGYFHEDVQKELDYRKDSSDLLKNMTKEDLIPFFERYIEKDILDTLTKEDLIDLINIYEDMNRKYKDSWSIFLPIL